MSWSALTYDWSQIRAFLATAEEGSLSAAARELGLTQPTLGRQVTALEARLGVTLFERAGRSLLLTQAGRDLLPTARQMRDAALEFSLAADGRSQAVTGTVSITATDFVASQTLPPLLSSLRSVAPSIEIEVISSNEVRDLTKREADISIRHARPEQPDLIAQQITEVRGYLYASPAYLDQVGRPKSLADLAGSDFIGFQSYAAMAPVLESFGLPFRREACRVIANSGAVISALAREGMGYTILTEPMAAHVGGLERALGDVFHVPVPVWLVTHRELHTARRIRIVFDHLATGLRRFGVKA